VIKSQWLVSVFEGDQLCQSVKLWQSKRGVRYQVTGAN